MDIVTSVMSAITGKRKPVVHKLKWKLPEERITCPIEDADKTVQMLEKKLKAKFLGGGSFSEVVHAKPYADGVFAYLMVRTDTRTQEETVVSDGYMIQEEDIHLGMDVTSAFKIDEDLISMGYQPAFSRVYKAWKFGFFEIVCTVYDIESFGTFLEIAIPATNFSKARERAEKRASDLLAKLSIDANQSVPTDVTTLQLMQQQEDQKNGGRKPANSIL
jgi:adenylate cyclase class IV